MTVLRSAALAAMLLPCNAAFAEPDGIGNDATPLIVSPPERVEEDGDRVAVQAPQAVSGAQMLIYIVPGVQDNGGADNTGVATSFHCTNKSGVAETIRFRVFSRSGALLGDWQGDYGAGDSETMSTHFTNTFTEFVFLPPGIVIAQGNVHVLATTKSVFCSAMIVDAANVVPSGIALHMVRFNPIPGTHE